MKSPFFAGFLTYPLLFLAFLKDDKFREIRLKCFVHWMPSTGTQPHGEMGTFCRKTIGKISGKAHHAARKKVAQFCVDYWVNLSISAADYCVDYWVKL